MAKELPFFKFEPSSWENGKIQMCSFEAQGIFMNVCSMYWQRLGDLPYKLAVQKICKGNATAFDSLIEDQIIKVVDGHICIDFLNEQLSEFDNVSKTNSENARLGWEKRRKEAIAMRPHTDPNAIRGEERRGEKKREDKIQSTSVDNEFEISILEIIRSIKSEYLVRDVKEYKITAKRRKLITNRKKDFNQLWPGRDFQKACAFAFRYKAKEWIGTETFRYFEPETLLSEKFISYLEKAEQDKGVPYQPEQKAKEDKVVYRIPE
jgi:hypothetical protein